MTGEHLIDFSEEQLVIIAEWLEVKEKAGYTLEQLVDEFLGRDRNGLAKSG